MKEQKGITLVALVITIIILLILAGISIAAIGSDNGLFGYAKKAKTNSIDAQNAENDAIRSYNNAIEDAIEGL